MTSKPECSAPIRASLERTAGVLRGFTLRKHYKRLTLDSGSEDDRAHVEPTSEYTTHWYGAAKKEGTRWPMMLSGPRFLRIGS